MNDDEFQKFMDTTYDEMELKQHSLQKEFGLGNYERYDLYPENQEIIFSSNSEIVIKANFIPIGTFATSNNSWMWGWNNSAFSNTLREKSEKLKVLAEITGFEIFCNPEVEIEEDMAWEMAAMSVHVLDAQGLYRAPANGLLYFYAIYNVSTQTS